MHRMFISVAVFLGVLVLSGSATLASRPFKRHGVIERLEAHQGLIIIGDVTFSLSSAARVHIFEKAQRAKEPGKDTETQPESGTIALLRAGMHIGYRVEGEGPGRQGRIVEAWILRPGSLPKAPE
jgi:hypothetical protein